MTAPDEINSHSEPQKITASEITIVDRKGKPRIRMAVDTDGTAAVEFLDGNERLRMALYLKEYDIDDEDFLFEEGSDNDSGLLVTGRKSGATIRLGICEDGLFGKRPRLEITEGAGWGKTRHRVPPRPPGSSD